MNKTQDKVLSILSKYVFNKNVIQKATVNSNLTKDLKINSARVVDIVLDVEDEFKIEVDNKALNGLHTIADIIKLIDERSSAE